MAVGLADNRDRSGSAGGGAGARAPLLRPFAGVGVLGGIERLLAGAAPASALLYLALTPLLAVLAVAIGDRAGRAVLGEER
jgi:hypothetical protein